MEELKYGKAKGIVLLNKYLPKINPFKKASIVKNIEDWNRIKDKYPEKITIRTDTLIGDTNNVIISGARGIKEEVPQLFQEVKKQNPNGVLLLIETKNPRPNRIENEGGFNIFFNLDKAVAIELVGKGFDARELTRGKAVHERYVIPWNEIIFLKNKKDLKKNEMVSKYKVQDEEYKKTRMERKNFLESIGYNDSEIQNALPNTYIELSDDIIEQVLNDIVFELYQKKNQLRNDGLNSFGVQGNIVKGKIEPWEIFREERLIKLDKTEEQMEELER